MSNKICTTCKRQKEWGEFEYTIDGKYVCADCYYAIIRRRYARIYIQPGGFRLISNPTGDNHFVEAYRQHRICGMRYVRRAW